MAAALIGIARWVSGSSASHRSYTLSFHRASLPSLAGAEAGAGAGASASAGKGDATAFFLGLWGRQDRAEQ